MNDPMQTFSPSMEELISLVADEFQECLARGECPAVEEYAQRYPQIAATLRRGLPPLGALFRAGGPPPAPVGPGAVPPPTRPAGGSPPAGLGPGGGGGGQHAPQLSPG